MVMKRFKCVLIAGLCFGLGGCVSSPRPPEATPAPVKKDRDSTVTVRPARIEDFHRVWVEGEDMNVEREEREREREERNGGFVTPFHRPARLRPAGLYPAGRCPLPEAEISFTYELKE